MTAISRERPFAIPSSQMMQMFGNNQIASRTLVLVATFAAAYFAFHCLPLPINQWLGYTIILTGIVHLFFGRFSRIVEVVRIYWPFPPMSTFHIRSSQTRNYTYTPSIHLHRTPYRSYGPPPVMTNSLPKVHHPTPRREPSIPIHTAGRQLGSIHPQTRYSGTRPVRKKADHYEPEYRERHLETSMTHSLPKAHHPTPRREPSIPIHTAERQLGSIYPQTRYSGTRPVRKKADHYEPEYRQQRLPRTPSTLINRHPSPIYVEHDKRNAELHLGFATNGTRPHKK